MKKTLIQTCILLILGCSPKPYMSHSITEKPFIPEMLKIAERVNEVFDEECIENIRVTNIDKILRDSTRRVFYGISLSDEQKRPFTPRYMILDSNFMVFHLNADSGLNIENGENINDTFLRERLIQKAERFRKSLGFEIEGPDTMAQTANGYFMRFWPHIEQDSSGETPYVLEDPFFLEMNKSLCVIGFH